MPGDPQPVYLARNEAEAQQTEAFLESCGIRTVRRYRSAPARLFGLTLPGREIVELLVDEEDADEARALLAQAEAGAFELEDDEHGS